MTLHIATSPYVSTCARKALRIPINTVPDDWMIGPCDVDLDRQMRLRAEYWERIWPHPHPGYRTPHTKTLRTLGADERVVVWMSPSVTDRVALWAFCSHRLRHKPTRPDLSLIVVGEIVPTAPPLLFNDAYFRINPTILRRARWTERPLLLDEVRERAHFWKVLTMPVPILSAKHPRTMPSHEELFAMGTYQAGFFPRRSEHRLSLSTLDTLLLSLVDETPGTPADIMVRSGEDGEIWKWMHLTGDIFLFDRLAQWAKHGVSPALHAEPWQAPSGWNTARYTLTDTGRAILRDGLTSIDQAPPLPIWGVTAYDPKNPWVVVEEAEGRPVLRLLTA